MNPKDTIKQYGDFDLVRAFKHKPSFGVYLVKKDKLLGVLKRGKQAIVETKALERLEGIVGVPQIYEPYADALFKEYIGGQLFVDVKFNPRSVEIVKHRIEDLITKFYERGCLQRDIHECNIVLSGGMTPNFIDYGIAEFKEDLTDRRFFELGQEDFNTIDLMFRYARSHV